jgi:hypothetical protein
MSKRSKPQNTTGCAAVSKDLLLVSFLVWSLETWLELCDYRIRLVRVLAADTMTHTWFAADFSRKRFEGLIEGIVPIQNDRIFRQVARLHLVALFPQAQ